jgi:hypothetical protein
MANENKRVPKGVEDASLGLSGAALAEAASQSITTFSERHGVKPDQLRLQREEVAYAILKRAQIDISRDAKSPKPIPTKFLVPFLEKSSTEEIQSELTDWWASLLVSASLDGEHHPALVEMLGRITAEEAQFLETFWDGLSRKPVRFGRSTILDQFKYTLGEKCREMDVIHAKNEGEFLAGIRGCVEAAAEQVRLLGAHFSHLQIPLDRFPFIDDFKNQRMLEICHLAGILDRQMLVIAVPSPFIGEFNLTAEYFSFSELGMTLMKTCHREPSEPSTGPP